MNSHPVAYPVVMVLLLISIGVGLFMLAHKVAAGPGSEIPNPDRLFAETPQAPPRAVAPPAPVQVALQPAEPGKAEAPQEEVVEKAPAELQGFGGLLIGTVTDIRDDGQAVLKVTSVADVLMGNADVARKWFPGHSILVQARLYNDLQKEDEEKLAQQLKAAHKQKLTVLAGVMVDYNNLFSVGTLTEVKEKK